MFYAQSYPALHLIYDSVLSLYMYSVPSLLSLDRNKVLMVSRTFLDRETETTFLLSFDKFFDITFQHKQFGLLDRNTTPIPARN